MANHPLEGQKLMKKILNNFFNSKIFEILPLIIQKRIRKFSNSYFCLTDNKTLPKNNYKINFSEKYQSFIIRNFGTDSYKSKNSFHHLNKLIKNLNFKDFIFLDIGAGDINTFLELNKNNNIKYLYYDLPAKNEIIKKIKEKYNFINLSVIDNIFEINFNLDFVFLGSSIGYHEEYNKILDFLISKNVKYILFTGIIIFDDENINSKHYILKQLNVIPNINYVYMFNRSHIEKQFLEKNYKISFSKDNDFKKINFDNLKYFCKKSNYTDILFEKIK